MSLKSEIDRTNTNKENLNKVATQIDDKLVALGGQKATNLADVPNKIKLLKTSYKNYAKITHDRKIQGSGSISVSASFYIPTNNLTFTPRFAVIQLAHMSDNNVIPNRTRHYSILLDMHNVREKSWKITNQGDYSRYVEVVFTKHTNSLQVDYRGQTYQGFEVTLKNVIFIGE